MKIINDILDFSRLEYGKMEPEHSPFDLYECFEDPTILLAPAAHEKGLELILLVYQDVPRYLVGDETRIRQILLNLVGNAIKFTHGGEIVVRVMLDKESTTHCTIQFSVTDTGIGRNRSSGRLNREVTRQAACMVAQALDSAFAANLPNQ